MHSITTALVSFIQTAQALRVISSYVCSLGSLAREIDTIDNSSFLLALKTLIATSKGRLIITTYFEMELFRKLTENG